MGKKDEIDKAEKKRKADFILEYANKDISDIKVPENPHPFRDGFDFDGRFRLPGAVKHLRKILDFEKESVEDSLDFFFEIYRQSRCISDNSTLPFITGRSPEIPTTPDWLIDLAQYLIELMRDKKFHFIGRVKKCQICSIYFIAKKRDKRIKYCPACSQKNKMTKEEQRSYMIAWRKKQKEKAEAKHKASEIKRFMDQGFTKQEAEQTYEEDREADKNM